MRNPFSRGPAARPFQRPPQTEVDDELAFHVEERVREYERRGMSPEAARAAAMERLGDLNGVRRECAQLLEQDRRAEARRDWFDDLRQDLRFGLRAMLREPLFTLLAIATLALGIGANAAVFGVVKSVLLDALPYADADRLVRIHGRFLDGSNERGALSAGTASDITARQRSFTGVAAFNGMPGESVYSSGADAQVVKIWWVEPRLFQVLGVSPAMGRPLRDEDARRDTIRTVLVSHAAWQRLFGGDPEAVGRQVRLNGIERTVGGVLPRDFVGPGGEADFYYPLDYTPVLQNAVAARGSHWLGMVGRLKPGVSFDMARRELSALGADLAREHPRDLASFGIATYPLRDALVGETRTPLLVLMASAALVLLITCANLAGALLSRTISRRKEFAVRVALGAGRGRLVRQLLTESTVLALAGGAAGVALAMAALGFLRSLATSALPAYAELSLDTGAVIVTSLVALATGIAFGLAPALSVGRFNPQGTLRDETRGASESRRSRRLRGALVAGQIALCVSLLAGAGLLVRSLEAMMSSPLGFDPRGVATVMVQLPNATYRTDAARVQFHEALEERLRGLPGVTEVATTASLPTDVVQHNGIFVVGAPPPPNDAVPFVLYSPVSDGYFRALSIPMLSGRPFGPQDRLDSPPVMIVSQAMARQFWPKGNAIGAQVRMGPDPQSTPFTIIGIAGDVRNDPARADAEPMAYGSARQEARPSVALLIRTSGNPTAILGALRREVSAIDKGVPLRNPGTLAAFLDERLVGRRLPVVLMSAFGVLALVLASVGVYAMFASMAAAREREFGVRVALGSTPRGIAALVIRQGAVWMGAGLMVGALGVFFVSRSLRELLFGVQPLDPIALGAAVLVLILFAIVALLVPVRRATRVDPVKVLR